MLKRILALLLLTASSAFAVDGVWNYDGARSWTNTAGWLDGIVAGGAGSRAAFTNNITGNRTITITDTITNGTLVLGDSAGLPGYNAFNFSGTGFLLFDGSGQAALIDKSFGNGNDTIAAPMQLNTDLIISNNSPGTLTLSGGITNINGGLATIYNQGTGAGLVSVATVGIVNGGANDIAVVQNTDSNLLSFGVSSTYSGGTYVKKGSIRHTQTPQTCFGYGTVWLGDTSGTNNATWIGNSNGTITNRIETVSGNTGKAILTAASATFTESGPIWLNNKSLYLEPSANMTLSGTMGGTGDLFLASSGTAIITLSTSIKNHAGCISNSSAGSGTHTISAILSNNITKVYQNSATSPMVLSGNNLSYTGQIVSSSGSLGIGHTNALGTGGLVLNGGNIYASAALNAPGVPNNISLLQSATISNANAFIHRGVISGAGGLTKVGSATLTLNGTNTYTGDTVAFGGLLTLANSNACANLYTYSGGTCKWTSATANMMNTGGNVYLTTGGKLDIANGKTQVVSRLYIDGAWMTNGLWGSTTSGVANTSAALDGLGVLNVQNYPTSSVQVIQIQFTGYSKTETLTNFPALVVISNNVGNSGFIYNTLLVTNGYDFRFWTNSTRTGTALNYELESWNTNGQSFFWVQVPELVNNSTIWASCGDTAYSTQPAYTTNGATWANGYLGVWHMKEPGNAPKDSALIPNDNSGTDAGTDGVLTNGIIGVGYSYSGNGLVSLNNSNDFSSLSTVTVSLWYYKRSTGGGAYGTVFGGPSFSWGLRHMATDSLQVRLNGTLYDPIGALANSSWHYLSYVFDDSANSLKGFRNGILGSTLTPSESWIPHVCLMGLPGADDRALDGIVDEMRIENVCRSSNWVWACYQNMASNSAFQTYTNYTASGVTSAWQVRYIYPPPSTYYATNLLTHPNVWTNRSW